MEKEKDLALITAIIITEDLLNGSVFQVFDQAYKLAQEFQKQYAHDFNWENQEIGFDDAIIEFVKSKIKLYY